MQNCISGDVNLGEHIISESLKFCAAIDKEKSSEINRFQRALVRVARLERAASTSQMWRPTNWATPGYFAVMIIARKSCDLKFFPVCGQSCGQSQFPARFAASAKSRKRPCCKGFRALAVPIVDRRKIAPKPPALPTALIPVIDFFRFQEVLLSVVIYVVKTLPAPSHRCCHPYNRIRVLRTSSFY